MADIAASVLARLKNKAAESGRSYQLCLQLFCQEQSRKKEKSPLSLMILLRRQSILIPLKRPLLRKLMQSSV